jgi:hypothetical protein
VKKFIKPGNPSNPYQCDDGPVYSFNQNNDHMRLLKPKTWNLFSFDMSNSESFISYFSNQSSGEIECTDDNNLMPIVSGIFIIGESS